MNAIIRSVFFKISIFLANEKISKKNEKYYYLALSETG